MRSTGIEIKVDIKKIPQEILDSGVLDIELSSKETKKAKEEDDKAGDYYILWVHDDGYKPFLEEHYQYLDAAEKVYNRKTNTDHLNIFLETEDELTEYDFQKPEKDKDGKETIVKYKNIKFSELGSIDLTKVKFKRDLKDK